MKKQFLLALLFAFVAMTAHATIRRVNNNPGVNLGANGYTNISDAISAAVNDDIIYVEPSPITYDGNPSTIFFSKRLKIIGNGAFLTDFGGVVGLSYQVNTNESRISVNFSFNGDACSGSAIYGVTIVGNVGIINSTNASNITIQRCKIGGSVEIYGTTNNISILENWIEGGIRHLPYGETSIATQWKIKNNIVFGTNTNAISILSNDQVVIENNVLCGSLPVLALNNCNQAVVINNVLNGRGTTPQILLGSDNATFNNNIASTAGGLQLPNTNGNQIGVDLTTVFNSFNSSSGPPFSPIPSSVQLRSGSPAIDAGIFGSGDDIGAFNNGTNRPTFVMGMIPPYPTIYALTVPGMVTTPTMQVTISTKSNN